METREAVPRALWEPRALAHQERVDTWIRPHLDRRRRGEKHPVHDFLFTYYSQRPSALRRWHPGYGVGLVDGPAPVGHDDLSARVPLVRSLHTLLAATATRAPALGCFGLH